MNNNTAQFPLFVASISFDNGDLRRGIDGVLYYTTTVYAFGGREVVLFRHADLGTNLKRRATFAAKRAGI